MLKQVAEHGMYVGITGFRNVQIADSTDFLEATRSEKPWHAWVQFFNADLVATWEHLYFAALNALTAFRSKRNISKSLAMETMLYASAQRQIKKALAQMGVKCGVSNVAVVVLGESPELVDATLAAVSKRVGVVADESVLGLSSEKLQGIRRAFGITETELNAVMTKDDVKQAVVNLVIERMALLQTQP
ncbi:MAG: KEOPS complex subunit Cgi121 [Candidatus Bathyarchaeota archaeon]|nr:KEOPS complex subunit Cgi121 [Candidatus Bathyarchaeota archaeon]